MVISGHDENAPAICSKCRVRLLWLPQDRETDEIIRQPRPSGAPNARRRPIRAAVRQDDIDSPRAIFSGFVTDLRNSEPPFITLGDSCPPVELFDELAIDVDQ